MIPKIIHLCWFSDDPFPVEIKVCLDSWHRVLPDYEVRRWTYQDAKAIGCRFIDEALAARKWAFAADVVRHLLAVEGPQTIASFRLFVTVLSDIEKGSLYFFLYCLRHSSHPLSQNICGRSHPDHRPSAASGQWYSLRLRPGGLIPAVHPSGTLP